MLYWIHLARTKFELTALVVINTDCSGSCISNYHTITTMTTPSLVRVDDNYAFYLPTHLAGYFYCLLTATTIKKNRRPRHFAPFQCISLTSKPNSLCNSISNVLTLILLAYWTNRQWVDMLVHSRHIILIVSQPDFTISLKCCVVSRKQKIQISLFWGVPQHNIELSINTRIELHIKEYCNDIIRFFFKILMFSMSLFL